VAVGLGVGASGGGLGALEAVAVGVADAVALGADVAVAVGASLAVSSPLPPQPASTTAATSSPVAARAARRESRCAGTPRPARVALQGVKSRAMVADEVGIRCHELLMSPELLRKPFHYDRTRRRLWIRGQRCHHGATGLLLAATGLLLMVHDWKDRGAWFARGWQDQK
jgi:hypothetical protein